MATDVRSEWYPYNKIYEGFYTLSQMRDIPRKIMDYLLDMPNGDYTPQDDNTHSRVALWKYLYYDGAKPLSNPLPTPEQKMSVLFNPDEPSKPPTEKGYRLFPQMYVKQAQTEAQSRMYVYLGRMIAESDFKIQASVKFEIWTHYTQEANTKTEAYSRILEMATAIVEAFHGVNMAGVGAFYFNRSQHTDCGMTPITDKDSNIGYLITLGLTIASEASSAKTPYNDIPLDNGFLG